MTARKIETLPTRRSILTAGLSGAALLALGCDQPRQVAGGRLGSASDMRGYGSLRAPAGTASAGYQPASTGPACGPYASCDPTEANIEGPFFKPNAPERTNLRPAGAKGVPLRLAGTVRSASCETLAEARIEVWQADHRGAYDDDGFEYRALLATGADGGWQLDSVVPGHYLNGRTYRPAHVHVKVHARGHRSLTTQLYFEGDPYNEQDPFIRESLIMKLSRQAELVVARYDFVLEPS
jgi:protocatechuate 3,4-dioxygenase beta subunit